MKEKESNFHRMVVSFLHTLIYQKDSESERVYISIEDDGKDGFIRIVNEYV
jgi:hypothetical protein